MTTAALKLIEPSFKDGDDDNGENRCFVVGDRVVLAGDDEEKCKMTVIDVGEADDDGEYEVTVFWTDAYTNAPYEASFKSPVLMLL